MHQPEGLVIFLLSSRRYTIWKSFYLYHRWRQYEYSCTAEDHISRVNTHALRKITHRESIVIHRGRSRFASIYSCIAEDHASRVNTYALRKIMHRESILMHCGKSCIASQYSCIVEEQASQASQANIQASREDIYASPRAVRREKISCLIVNYAM